MSRAYYNEIDPAAAYLLRCLIEDGVIAAGDVDERSISDVQPEDLKGYTQCHFFAGGGLWSVAARLAGWTDERPLWTGSCPCQPFSVAGKGKGKDDSRHLWPDFLRLIRSCRPPVVLGEQVAGKAGYDWFDGVRSDLAGEGYAGRAVDIPACSADAPHIRQRLYWAAVDRTVGLADASSTRLSERDWSGTSAARQSYAEPECGGVLRSDMADAEGERVRGWRPAEAMGAPGEREGEGSQWKRLRSDDRNADDHMVDAFGAGLEGHAGDVDDGRQPRRLGADQARPVAETGGDGGRDLADADRGGCGGWPEEPQRGEIGGASPEWSRRNGTYWSDYEWRVGADGKARRVKPDLRLLVDGFPNRVAALRIAGNAIVPVLAAEVIAALMETLP